MADDSSNPPSQFQLHCETAWTVTINGRIYRAEISEARHGRWTLMVWVGTELRERHLYAALAIARWEAEQTREYLETHGYLRPITGPR